MLRLPPGTLPPKYPASAISRNKNVTPYWHYFFYLRLQAKQHPARQGGMLLIPFYASSGARQSSAPEVPDLTCSHSILR
ncbi:hypothetical protein SEEA9517_04134 [Salmonella enterica subsp. enterica serovar Agona str. 400095 17]|nr:hypothetical protein [Salmonella enterica]EGL0585780.1 hypothetical protein [Salmonella enterica subsp. enterica serovar Agona]ELP11267.1 hypothetical protein F514_18846 [Salmonella enterica subsp. enterica serovar Agona str. SH08SF124]ESB04695.1 hypothetical protein SEEA3871_18234 [Salmonella enterica subsp. enterica serovar Agona str. 311387-1]ESB23583.1 hypothetical protein SEEA0411_09960 [Salmonella enterica subsp. enterica serovar Agona str. 460004 1-1]ESB31162.1 hypothetical protein S